MADCAAPRGFICWPYVLICLLHPVQLGGSYKVWGTPRMGVNGPGCGLGSPFGPLTLGKCFFSLNSILLCHENASGQAPQVVNPEGMPGLPREPH